eukprot:TCONS_00023830-protein
MSGKKRGQDQYKAFLEGLKDKKSSKGGKFESFENLTVQRMSTGVSGKLQTYDRIGPLTYVNFNGMQLTLDNIKKACKNHFHLEMKQNQEIQILAGERGPSWTQISEIKKFVPLHIRFVPGKANNETSFTFKSSLPPARKRSANASGIFSNNSTQKSHFPTSKLANINGPLVSLPPSKYMKMGQLIEPQNSKLKVFTLEEFNVNTQRWRYPL